MIQTRIAESFWSKVQSQESHECWDWTGSVFQATGYGQFASGRRYGLSSNASRAAWMLAHGPIPSGLYVCHKCDNKLCCNPEHLFLGTQQDNMDDLVAKGRQCKGESHGKSRLTQTQVEEILKDSRKGKAVAKEYGISEGHLSYIKSRRKWSHITKEQENGQGD